MHSTVGKKLFGHKYQLSSDQFKEGIKRIDKVTKDLEKKEALNNYDLTIKELTRNNPTMPEKFKQARNDREGVVFNQSGKLRCMVFALVDLNSDGS
jgi:hypothetical protein